MGNMLSATTRPLSVFWLIALTGMVLPWITGAAVKLYLDAQGRPTVPWVWFWEYFTDLHGLFVLILYTIAWAIPHIVLGQIATATLQVRPRSPTIYSDGIFPWATRVEKSFILAVALVCGSVGQVWVFVGLFSLFNPVALGDTVYAVVPIFYGLPYGLAMAFGALMGYLLVKAFRGIKMWNKKRY